MNAGEQNKRSTLHAKLKKIVADELDKLPETLEQMEPEQRAKVVLQLLPYTLPKIETVGESYTEDWTW